MASIHKDRRGKSPFWYGAFTTPDGKRHFKSTKTASKKQAEAIAGQWQKAANLAATGKLSPERIREALKTGIEEVLAATGDTLPSYTVRQWVARWMDGKTEAREQTLACCRKAGEYLIESLGPKADRDITLLTADDVAKFKEFLSRQFKPSTTNLYLTKTRECLGAAVKRNILTLNPALSVEKLAGCEGTRRAFTRDELKRVLDVCDTEWRGMVLIGAYIGARIGDAAVLTWDALDLAKSTLTLGVKKTGKTLEVPLAKPLRIYLEALPAGDTDPRKTPLFPSLFELSTSSLSGRFSELLLTARLVEPCRKNSNDKHRIARELSFHSLRHTCISQMKATGASNSMAQALAGHSSGAVNQRYTHLSAEDLRAAVDAMPDVTAD